MSEQSTIDASYFTGTLPFRMTNDYLFKVLLQTNTTVLKALICSFTRLKPDDIKEIIVTNPVLLGRVLTDKEMILDVKAVLNDDCIVNLEMQVVNYHNWEERSMSYLARCFDNLQSSEDYSKVKSAIHIGFVDYTVKPEAPQFYSTYRMIEIKNSNLLTGKFELNMVDLSRRDLATDEDVSVHRLCWADFFKATTWEELTMLANQDTNIADAVVTIKKLSEEEYFRLCCEAQEDRIRCENDMRHYYEKELEEAQEDRIRCENDMRHYYEKELEEAQEDRIRCENDMRHYYEKELEEAKEDRIRCENDMRHYYENKIEECDNTIKEQDNTIKEHKAELERLYKIIEARDKEILELKQKNRN